MKCYVVIIHPPAFSDVERLHQLVFEKFGSGVAERWIRGVFAEFDTLATMPRRGKIAPENTDHPVEVRQLVRGRRRGRYRILYTIQGQNVHILHVRLGAPRENERLELEDFSE